jgi:mono/diheme cytochrome c family protein
MTRAVVIAVVAILVILLIGTIAIASMVRSGLSAHEEPTRIEAAVARTVRHWAVPAELRDAKNPVPLTPAILTDGRAHFADHCAICHGNDGKGESGMGKQMYPKTPDMTLPATQSLSDGELFAIIENGVRLTGMPGFGGGTAASAQASWELVHFIRHLPKLAPAEMAEMRKLNPKSPDECQEKAFLASGGDEAPAPPTAAHAARPHQH